MDNKHSKTMNDHGIPIVNFTPICHWYDYYQRYSHCPPSRSRIMLLLLISHPLTAEHLYEKTQSSCPHFSSFIFYLHRVSSSYSKHHRLLMITNMPLSDTSHSLLIVTLIESNEKIVTSQLIVERFFIVRSLLANRENVFANCDILVI